MNQEKHEQMNHDMKMNYRNFAAMIAISMVAMYAFMYLHLAELSHLRWSTMNLYMTVFMGASMSVIMLGFMRGMYTNKRINRAIYIGSVVVFLITLFLVRTQILERDQSFMSAMIPHHSMAILNSENAQLEDVRVRQLADGIIESQRREIDEMNWLLADIAENGIASTQEEADARPVPEFGSEP